MTRTIGTAGNGSFEDDATGNARVAPGSGTEALAAAGHALQAPDLHELLLHRSLNVRGEMMRIDLRAEQAESLLRGVLKSLYTLGFSCVSSCSKFLVAPPPHGHAAHSLSLHPFIRLTL